ncbi:MAG TPA: hypothetical protein VF525_02735 [Pyrinomonadaceae bacterium]|jgi:hypothetical protein
MKIFLRGLALATATTMLMAAPLKAQQQIEYLARTDSASGAGEEGRAKSNDAQTGAAGLQRRLVALQRYLATIDPSFSEYGATERAIQAIKLKLENLRASKDAKLSPAQFAHTGEQAPDFSARPVLPMPGPAADSTNAYKNAPPLLLEEVDRTASAIVDEGTTSPISATWDQMLFYAVADAVAPADTAVNARSIRTLKAYQYLGETARTDKQVGASAKSEGSTSAIEKPGFVRLLGFAVENGAIQQDISKTSLTLSTSPYVLYTMNGEGDTAETYERAGFLNRIGLFANFNLQNQDVPLANAKRSQLDNWSVKVRAFGDRSTRSKSFLKFWQDNVQQPIENRLNVLTGAFEMFENPSSAPFQQLKDAETPLKQQMQTLLGSAAYKTADATVKKTQVTNLILSYLKSAVVDKVTGGSIALLPADRDTINKNHVQALAEALNRLEVVRKILDDRLDDLNKSPLGTFSYTNYRKPTASDYSEFKFLYEQDKSVFRLLKLVGNIGATIYNRPDPALNQQRLRDFTAALSFEGKTKRPFLNELPDLSRITYAFTGSYQRMKENNGMPNRKADIGTFQFRVEVPLFAGMSLPLAVTYANATEMNKKEHTRANFGFTVDIDKMLAATRLSAAK